MPLEVLGRERVEEQNNMRDNALKQEQMKQEGIQKAWQLKLMSDELKLKAKIATDEMTKLELTNKAERFKALSSATTDIMKMPGDPQKNMLTHYQMFQDQWHEVIGDKDFQAMISKLKPSGEEQFKQESAATLRNFNLQHPAPNAPQVGAVQGNAPAAQDLQTGGQSGTPQLNAINGNIPQAPQGEWTPDTLGPSGINMKYSDPQQMVRDVRAKTIAEKQATREVELEPVLKAYGALKNTFYASVEEMGGLGESALGARVKGSLASLQSQFGKMPATQAFQQMIGAFSISLASIINKGRPTDADQKAALQTLFSNKYPMATNMYLMNYIESILMSGDEGKIKDLANSLFRYTDSNGKPISNRQQESFYKRVEDAGKKDARVMDRLIKAGKTKEEAESMIYEIRSKQGLR